MGARKYDWDKLKPDIMLWICEGKSFTKILDLLYEKYDILMEQSTLAKMCRKWKDEE